MQLPTIHGLIRRRLLINYRIAPEVVARHLPAPFRPKLVDGVALAGLCLIRLEHVRPRGIPAFCGITSENAAHRVGVEWTAADGTQHEGVYILRRDTNSRLNHWAGGRLFPGEHRLACFTVEDSPQSVRLAMQSRERDLSLYVEGRPSGDWPPDSVFPDLAAASRFHQAGSLGYSCSDRARHFDGLLLATDNWQVEPFEISRLESSFFSAIGGFPAGSIELDHALIMRNIEHRWHAAASLAAGN